MPPLSRTAILFSLLVLAFVVSGFTQSLPKKIDGYRVHNEIISLKGSGAGSAGAPYLIVGEPAVSDISLSGITIAIVGKLEAAGYDGEVQRMSFKDFQVNGVKVEVQDFVTPFKVSKRGSTVLPAPATVFLPTAKILSAAWKEVTDSKNEWTVTGRVLVFGKFKKFGFSFKRAIPVDIELTVKNPLLEYRQKATPETH